MSGEERVSFADKLNCEQSKKSKEEIEAIKENYMQKKREKKAQ